MKPALEAERYAFAGDAVTTQKHIRARGNTTRRALCGAPAPDFRPEPFAREHLQGVCADCFRTLIKRHGVTQREPSVHETEMLRQIVEARLAPPVREYEGFGHELGRGWRLDFAWPAQRVVLEVEGDIWHGQHTQGTGFEDDCVKYAALACHGWTVLRATPRLVKEGYALRWLQTVLTWGGRRVIDPAIFPRPSILRPKKKPAATP